MVGEESLPRIWTVEEIAEYLKVSQEVVQKEIDFGKINGFKVGEQWRCTQEDIQAYIRQPRVTIQTEAQSAPVSHENVWALDETGPFDFTWPRVGGGKVEHYEKGFNCTKLVDGQQVTFRLGFSERVAAGRMRKRVTIWLGSRPLVEFAGSNNFEQDGTLASIIRLKNNKQLTYQRIPAEYEVFKVKRYNSVVNGPKASNSFAVVVNKDDLPSMLEHALIRARWKGLL